MDGHVTSGNRPKIMVTNDDGIDAPGLPAPVQFLVSTNLYEVLVCAPDSDGETQFSEDDTDYQCLQEGYIAVTPLGALSPADIDCQAYYKTLVPGMLGPSFSSAS